MLSKEDNEALCRVGPGTLMGNLFRRYWLPLMFESELKVDDAPVRIRILGEDLMAFKDTEGHIGAVEELCPHRLAPLYIGRNEESGIRCLYHGWKFDVSGECVDMPNEPAESTFKTKVHLRSYATNVHAGVIWIYMGDQDRVPGFPVYLWTTVPETHRVAARWIQEANWMQSLEGGIDTSHASFLHRRFDANTRAMEQDVNASGGTRDLMWQDKAPRLEVEPTNFGFRYAAIREAPEGKKYVRITPHIMPCSSYPPGVKGQNRIWDCWVPRDDESCWAWDTAFNETRPLDPVEVEGLREMRGYNAFDPATFRKYGNKDNRWLQNREEMKTVSWTGIRGIFAQDNAVQEGMGTIVDRTREHLGTADLAIITARRQYLNAARDLAEHGIDPPGVQTPETYTDIRSYAFIQEPDDVWHQVQPLDQKFIVAAK
jgi:phthalate 4,5-dioxygenase oxygenase subunit